MAAHLKGLRRGWRLGGQEGLPEGQKTPQPRLGRLGGLEEGRQEIHGGRADRCFARGLGGAGLGGVADRKGSRLDKRGWCLSGEGKEGVSFF